MSLDTHDIHWRNGYRAGRKRAFWDGLFIGLIGGGALASLVWIFA